MGSAGVELKVAFLPFAAPGHMIPLMNIARLFAMHGADVTFITTPATASRFQNVVDSDLRRGHKIKLHTFQLPSAEAGLPPGVESFNECTSKEMTEKLFGAFEMLNGDIEQFLQGAKVDCIVSDTILVWTLDAAARLGIPRIAFRSSGFFSECIHHSLRCHKPHKKVGSDTEPFIFPGLPHKIEITRLNIPQWYSEEGYIQHIEKMKEMDKKSYAVLLNTFYELEADYVEYFESVIGLKTWIVGPVSLWANEGGGKNDSRTENNNAELMEWLDSKQPNSVLYVSFGSMTKFPSAQVLEIAHGLEDSGCHFIWVVRKMNESEAADEEFPEGFEERVRESKRGLIIRDWAPQELILNHAAVGGFVTHCGWNSILESVCAGRPIIAWPLSAEQFFNEKFVTRVLKVGVSIGVRKWWGSTSSETLDVVKRDRIAEAVARLMGDDREVVEMRDGVRELSHAAKRAIKEGGSSHSTLLSLIHELKTMKFKRQSSNVDG